jgi:hypothetical protein
VLSPARHFEQVPRELQANLKFRKAVLEECQNSQVARKACLQMCKDDIFWWIDTFGWQFNPDHFGGEVGPFITWDWQQDAIRRTIHRLFMERRSALWEKSRKMGGTWMALFVFDWLSLFHDWKQTLALSHMEQAVDRTDDKDTLFWKVNFIHEHLPHWMLRGVTKSKLLFNYPATNSTFAGAATTERSGVGGRGNVLLDEFSKHRRDREILGQTAQTGPRLFIGTHYGLSGAFFDLTQRPDQFKIQMHWSLHPEYRRGLYRLDPERPGQPLILDQTYSFPPDYKFVLDGKPAGGPHPGLRSPWYDAQCEEMGNDRDVAMHLDIDPAGSAYQFFEPIKIRELVTKYCRPPVWTGDVLYDRWTGELKGLREDPAGRLKLWVHPDSRGELPTSSYTAGADISAGTGATCSTFSGIDALRGQKVLEYANPNLDPKDYATIAVALCQLLKDKHRNGAYFAWECAGPVGQVFGKRVVELNYTNFFRRRREFKTLVEMTDEPGWYPGGGCKRALLHDYREALVKGLLLNPSELSLQECLKFEYDREDVVHGGSKNTDDPSAGRSNHGDQVIADALAWMLAKEKAAPRPGERPRGDTVIVEDTVGWLEELSQWPNRKLARRY